MLRFSCSTLEVHQQAESHPVCSRPAKQKVKQKKKKTVTFYTDSQSSIEQAVNKQGHLMKVEDQIQLANLKK